MVSGMALVRMALGGYRGFAQRQVIELRPITVVLGRNNAGKSALVRAPVILGTGIGADTPEPFDLDRLAEDLVDSFPDLIHGRRVHRGSIDVELGVDTAIGHVKVAATVLHLSDHHTQVVELMELSLNGAELCQLEWDLDDPPRHPLHYSVSVGDQTWSGVPVAFRGLLPVDFTDGPPPEVTEAVRDAVTALDDAYPTVRYLGPFRDRPHRRYRLPGRMRTEVGTAGEFAAGILASDLARGGGRLLRQVNADLADHLPGWRVDVAPDGGIWSVVLVSTDVSTDDDAIRVNLADTGTGVAQVLPIFVQRAIDAIHLSRQPVLEIIEQPELHLHPAAHADLAELFLTAVRTTSTRFLIETHSETLLLRLRRHIAEGLDPSTVAVYFVDRAGGESFARRIHIDPDGNLDYWPAGVFAEDYEETRALVRAQRERRRPDAG
jgi:AAA ATPase-like protein/uncharacterized protein DUF3696